LFVQATLALAQGIAEAERYINGGRGGDLLKDTDLAGLLALTMFEFNVNGEIIKLPLTLGTRLDAAALTQMFGSGKYPPPAPDVEPSLTVAEAKSKLDDLERHVIADLASVIFLTVDASRSELYQQREPLFGSAVADRFGDANDDIANAGRCLAVEQWDAAVFHLMRVLEHGLRAFTRKLGVTKVDIKEWGALIGAIEGRMKAIRDQKRTTRRDARLQYFSECAANLRYFKDGWRNYVTHGKKAYDEKRAMAVYSHVHTFMELLAEDAPR
jgi:hypothetical protein